MSNLRKCQESCRKCCSNLLTKCHHLNSLLTIWKPQESGIWNIDICSNTPVCPAKCKPQLGSWVMLTPFFLAKHAPQQGSWEREPQLYPQLGSFEPLTGSREMQGEHICQPRENHQLVQEWKHGDSLNTKLEKMLNHQLVQKQKHGDSLNTKLEKMFLLIPLSGRDTHLKLKRRRSHCVSSTQKLQSIVFNKCSWTLLNCHRLISLSQWKNCCSSCQLV